MTANPDGTPEVLAIRCMKHRRIPPLNKCEASGAECPICYMENAQPSTEPGQCWKCGSPKESTIHDTESKNTEIRMGAHQFVANVAANPDGAPDGRE